MGLGYICSEKDVGKGLNSKIIFSERLTNFDHTSSCTIQY